MQTVSQAIPPRVNSPAGGLELPPSGYQPR